MKIFDYKSLLKVITYIFISMLLLLFFNSCDETTPGCIDSTACNLDSNATEDDGSCTYAQPNFDCSGECLVELDCAGNCAGGYIIDDCDDCVEPENENAAKDCTGVCDGSAVTDCQGICAGSAVYDDCGLCAGNNYFSDGLLPNGSCDCYAATYSIAFDTYNLVNITTNPADIIYQNLDECGVCAGDGNDCNGECCSNWDKGQCLVMPSGQTQTEFPTFIQSEFCEENFSAEEMCNNPITNDQILCLTQCNDFTTIDMVNPDSYLESFCDLHFGCAQESEANICSPGCTGGSTGITYYDLCGCFESDADNFWCNNNGGQCVLGLGSASNCQDECILDDGVGNQIIINPFTYEESGYVVDNDIDSCIYFGCTDENACNYDVDATDDDGSCQDSCTNYLKIGEIDEENHTIEILINSDQEIGGFQMEFTNVTLTSDGSGGAAEEAGFTISTGATTVIGFSLTGSTIPSTGGIELPLTIINYTEIDAATICAPYPTGDTCDQNCLVISDALGGSISEFIIHYEDVCP